MSAARRENIEKEEAKGAKSSKSWNGTKQQVFRERRRDFEESRSKRKKRGRWSEKRGRFFKKSPTFFAVTPSFLSTNGGRKEKACEGCESKKCKIADGRAYTHARRHILEESQHHGGDQQWLFPWLATILQEASPHSRGIKGNCCPVMYERARN